MVVQDAVGHERVQVPALHQPGTGLGMRDLQRELLYLTQFFIVQRPEIQAVFIGGRRQQRQSPDVMHQARQISFFGASVGHFFGNFPG